MTGLVRSNDFVDFEDTSSDEDIDFGPQTTTTVAVPPARPESELVISFGFRSVFASLVLVYVELRFFFFFIECDLFDDEFLVGPLCPL